MNRRKFIYTSAGITGVASLSEGFVLAGSKPAAQDGNAEVSQKEVLKQLQPVAKYFYNKAKRLQNGSYYPVMDDTSERETIAFLRIKGTREELVVRQNSDKATEKVIAANTYIFDPEFCGGDLFWVEKEGKSWKIKWSGLQGENAPKAPFSHWGRPLSVQGYFANNRKYLVWEERQGKKTKIFLGIIDAQGNVESTSITSGENNAYDPVCSLGANGLLYIAYTTFYKGNYHIFLQKATPDGKVIGNAIRITHGDVPSLYPSLAPHPERGVWVSYTKYNVPFEFRDWDIPYVEHPRRNAQHNFFQSHGLVHAGYFDGQRLWAPLAPPVPGKLGGGIAAMVVFGSEGAGRSRIFTDEAGNVNVLFRKYQKGTPPRFDKEEKLQKKEAGKQPEASHLHPDLCLSRLQENYWPAPVTLVNQAHFDGKITFNQTQNTLRIAFAEDGRQVGWSGQGEWFDTHHETGVGILEIVLAPLGKPAYSFHPYLVKPVGALSMEEPAFSHNDENFIYAKGQTHKHTNHSICTREFDMDHHMNYRFLQDVMHCDFGAITDHSYNFWQTEILYLNKAADYYYFPGEFVALPAYEWTSKEGHINPLYFEEEGSMEVFQPNDTGAPGSTFDDLWKQYARKKILTPPHHMADAMLPFNWEQYEAQFMPVAEVFQDNRGSCEQPEVPGVTNYFHTTEKKWAVDQLNIGKKIGLMASADHVGVAQAIVMVKNLTRTDIYQAFQERRCLGSTGISLQLDFRCNGKWVGSEVADRTARFTLRVKSPENISEIYVLRDGKNYKTLEAAGKEKSETWEVQPRRTGEYWFCRILFESGEMAWSSPIWLV